METALDLYAAHGFWVWAAVAAGLLALEVMLGTGWLLWPSAAAGVVAVCAQLFGLTAPLDVVTFAGLTIVLTLVSRRFVTKDLAVEGADINDNAARLVGHQGSAVAAFAGGQGRVFIDGKEWAAVLVEGEILAAGAKVVVQGVDGAKLKVSAAAGG